MILDGAECPRFIGEPLSQVDEKFAWDEGEGDDTREWWLTAHRRYFARQTARQGFDLEGNPLAVFDHFEIVWPLNVADMISGPKSGQQKLVTGPHVRW